MENVSKDFIMIGTFFQNFSKKFKIYFKLHMIGRIKLRIREEIKFISHFIFDR